MGLLKDLSSRGSHLVDVLTSQLGSHNPFSHSADPETTVAWLFDNTAYQTSGSKWQAEFIAAYFERRCGTEASNLVTQLAKAVGVGDDEQARSTIAKRLTPLLNQIQPATTAKIAIQASEIHSVGPSGPDGISRDILDISPGAAGTNVLLESTFVEDLRGLKAKTLLAHATGWGIVSDIDDTIKKTLTNTPTGILKTTFVDEPEVIRGMPELYKKIQQELDPAFWYLSASPYNLYPFLREFRDSHFPHGTLLLRNASWMNLAGFVACLTSGTEQYKVENLENIHNTWSQRHMICIGDSTQSDPEAYGAAYRSHPDWIKLICIRRVQGVLELTDILPGQDQESRNKPERFEKAFHNVPRSTWHIFDEPEDLLPVLEPLFQAANATS